ncbi:MAG: SRPBCC family protein [Tumebacillaceae bacterium]
MQENKQGTLPDIVKTVVFNAPIDKVWNAVSTAEGISAWFMPGDLKAEVGHEFTINAGNFGMSPCKVTEVDPPNRLGFDWGKDWHLAFELKDLDGKTEFTLIHSGWDAETVTEFGQPHTMVRGFMDEGWDKLASGSLRAYVEA